MKKNKKQKVDQDPFPQDLIAQRLLKYFDYQWQHLRARPRRYTQVQWRTEKRYKISKLNLWKDWQKKSIIIGMGFDKTCRRLMIDIDINSSYHPKNNEDAYHKLLELLEDLGLCRPIIVQSSYSKGIHIYYFFSESVKTFKLAKLVKMTLVGRDFNVESGQIEIFPNPKLYAKSGQKPTNYRMHRLPLQPDTGSIMLTTWGLTPEIEGESLKKFADAADWSANGNDLNQIIRMIEFMEQDENKQFYKTLKSRRKVNSLREHLIDFIEQGWTNYHETNIILQKIGMYYYLFEDFRGEELLEKMVVKAMSLSGYRQYCRHQHEIEQRCKDWANSVQKYYTTLFSKPKRKQTYEMMFKETVNNTSDYNERSKRAAQDRIKRAYDVLQKLGELPKKVIARSKALMLKAKQLYGKTIGINTLYRQENLILWHPKYRKELHQEVLLESLPGVKQKEKISPNDVVCKIKQKQEYLEPFWLKVLAKKYYSNSYMKGLPLGFFFLSQKTPPEFSVGFFENEFGRGLGGRKLEEEFGGKQLKEEEFGGKQLKEEELERRRLEEEELERRRLEEEELERRRLEEEELERRRLEEEELERRKLEEEELERRKLEEEELERRKLEEEELTWDDVKKVLNQWFIKSIKQLPPKEKLSIIGERLKLISKAEKQALSQYRLKLDIFNSDNNKSLEFYQIHERIKIFRGSSIDLLKTEGEKMIILMNIF